MTKPPLPTPEPQWLPELRSAVEKHPIVVFRLGSTLDRLQETSACITDFTLMREHDSFQAIVQNSVCIVLGKLSTSFGPASTKSAAYLCIIGKRERLASLETRVHIHRALPILPSTERALLNLVQEGRQHSDFKRALQSREKLVKLSPKVSLAIVNGMVQKSANHRAMKSVTEMLPGRKRGLNHGLQLDAIRTALKIFGLKADTIATTLQTASSDTALKEVRVREDDVIAKDAVSYPNFKFVGMDLTGKASFRNGKESLDVFTANRKPLEDVFGIDLIYLNHHHNNAVLIQYKMLKKSGGTNDSKADWQYTKERHFPGQIAKMRKFSQLSGAQGYRLNSEGFYFKFVRNELSESSSNVLIPLGHMEELMLRPEFKNSNGNLKISYAALKGHYMRQDALFSLIQSGYIGSHVETTDALSSMIQAVVCDDSAAVIAIQRATTSEEHEEDSAANRRRYSG